MNLALIVTDISAGMSSHIFTLTRMRADARPVSCRIAGSTAADRRALADVWRTTTSNQLTAHPRGGCVGVP